MVVGGGQKNRENKSEGKRTVGGGGSRECKSCCRGADKGNGCCESCTYIYIYMKWGRRRRRVRGRRRRRRVRRRRKRAVYVFYIYVYIINPAAV